MPSLRNTSASSSADSGSSFEMRWEPRNTMVTLVPKRVNACASSTAIGPPPQTINDFGAVCTCTASRLVQNGVPSRPGIAGTTGLEPGLSTTARRARKVRWPPSGMETVTSRGPVNRPVPRTSRPPVSVKRLAATASSQLSVASLRMRPATVLKSGVTSTVPAMPGMRSASATTFPARIIILEGMQP